MHKQIAIALKKKLPADLVDRLVDHHAQMRMALAGGDWEKALVRGGKFAETVMKVIHHQRTGHIVTNIHVDHEIQEAEKATALPHELRLLIPRHVRVMYDHRNKRGGGHDSFEPAEMDVTVNQSLADWCLSELLRLYGGFQTDQALAIVRAITARTVPLTEEIAGDLVILTDDATARQEAGIVLYKCYPTRVTRAKIFESSAHKDAAVRSAVSRMKAAKEVHENGDGLLLTTLGLARVEQWVGSAAGNTTGRGARR